MKQNEYIVEIVLELLKQKDALTDLEKDIVSSSKVLSAVPFDRDKAEETIKLNNIKYPDVFITINSSPGVVNKSFEIATDEEVRDNLRKQLILLCSKNL